MSAEGLVRQAGGMRAQYCARELDVALTDHARRHGTARFEVTQARATANAVEFVVEVRAKQ